MSNNIPLIWWLSRIFCKPSRQVIKLMSIFISDLKVMIILIVYHVRQNIIVQIKPQNVLILRKPIVLVFDVLQNGVDMLFQHFVCIRILVGVWFKRQWVFVNHWFVAIVQRNRFQSSWMIRRRVVGRLFLHFFHVVKTSLVWHQLNLPTKVLAVGLLFVVHLGNIWKLTVIICNGVVHLRNTLHRIWWRHSYLGFGWWWLFNNWLELYRLGCRYHFRWWILLILLLLLFRHLMNRLMMQLNIVSTRYTTLQRMSRRRWIWVVFVNLRRFCWAKGIQTTMLLNVIGYGTTTAIFACCWIWFFGSLLYFHRCIEVLFKAWNCNFRLVFLPFDFLLS